MYSTLLAHLPTPGNIFGVRGAELSPPPVARQPFLILLLCFSSEPNHFFLSQEAAGAYDAEAIRVFGDAHPPLNFPVSNRRMLLGEKKNVWAAVVCAVCLTVAWQRGHLSTVTNVFARTVHHA